MDHNYPIILHDTASGDWLHFKHPRQIVTALKPGDVLPALREVEAAVQTGLHAAGFISYEAAPGFDGALAVRPDNFPLLWFGLYPAPERTADLPPRDGEYRLGKWRPTISRKAFNAAISQIKRFIAQGATYQVNYTFRLRNSFSGSPWALFLDLVNAQAPGYSAYVDTGKTIICSTSPELFFKLDGQTITSRPMKGTVKRGRTLIEDMEEARWLQTSPKNRAENVMIVDMIRNDLGRIAKIGSVQVPELFVAERYPTLWQMTSSVTAESSASFPQILAALFPCASITGAPKVSTMQIIAGLETTPRRIYTGAIGYLSPGRQAQFSVAIRSVLIDREKGQAEYGVGGGIVWDSTSRDEYAEALLKAQVLINPRPEFSLLETLAWKESEGFSLLPEHLQRLADSAAYFGFPFNAAAVEATLVEAGAHLPGPAHRLRLLLDRQGTLSHQVFPFPTLSPETVLKVRLAKAPVDSRDIFLYHKTTWRGVYKRARQEQPDCDDILLFNERGELTESTIANLVFDLQGELVTPPVDCGLLPGTLRGNLLRSGRIRERVVRLEDLPACRQIFLVNSVRGWQKAELLPGQSAQVTTG